MPLAYAARALWRGYVTIWPPFAKSPALRDHKSRSELVRIGSAATLRSHEVWDKQAFRRYYRKVDKCPIMMRNWKCEEAVAFLIYSKNNAIIFQSILMPISRFHIELNPYLSTSYKSIFCDPITCIM